MGETHNVDRTIRRRATLVKQHGAKGTSGDDGRAGRGHREDVKVQKIRGAAGLGQGQVEGVGADTIKRSAA